MNQKQYSVTFTVNEDSLRQAFAEGHDISPEECPSIESMISSELNWLSNPGISFSGEIKEVDNSENNDHSIFIECPSDNVCDCADSKKAFSSQSFGQGDQLNGWILTEVIESPSDTYALSCMESDYYIGRNETGWSGSESLNEIKGLKFKLETNFWKTIARLVKYDEHFQFTFYINLTLLSDKTNWMKMCWEAASRYLKENQTPPGALNFCNAFLVLNSYPTASIKFQRDQQLFALNIDFIEWVVKKDEIYYVLIAEKARSNYTDRKLLPRNGSGWMPVSEEEVINAYPEFKQEYRKAFALKLIEQLVTCCHSIKQNYSYHSNFRGLHYWKFHRKQKYEQHFANSIGSLALVSLSQEILQISI